MHAQTQTPQYLVAHIIDSDGQRNVHHTWHSHSHETRGVARALSYSSLSRLDHGVLFVVGAYCTRVQITNKCLTRAVCRRKQPLHLHARGAVPRAPTGRRWDAPRTLREYHGRPGICVLKRAADATGQSSSSSPISREGQEPARRCQAISALALLHATPGRSRPHVYIYIYIYIYIFIYVYIHIFLHIYIYIGHFPQ